MSFSGRLTDMNEKIEALGPLNYVGDVDYVDDDVEDGVNLGSCSVDCGYCGIIPYVGNAESFSEDGIISLETINRAKVKGLGETGSEASIFNKPLYVSDHFVVVPTVGCFMEGYLLAISRDHVYSMAELGTEKLEDIELYLTNYVSELETVFGEEYLIFEHGSGGPEKPGGSCVRHAHFHLMPIGHNAIEKIRGCDPAIKFETLDKMAINLVEGSDVISAWPRLSEFEGENYAFMDDGAESWIWVEPLVAEKRLIGQWIRREVARFFGFEQWDWAADSCLDNARKTRKKLLDHFVQMALDGSGMVETVYDKNSQMLIDIDHINETSESALDRMNREAEVI